MGWKSINIQRYASVVKKELQLTHVPDELIYKDLLLTLLLNELNSKSNSSFSELIFKGRTLLSRVYLNYHRFSEDLDFVHKKSTSWRVLPRRTREGQIKKFINNFLPELYESAQKLELDFKAEKSNTRYCSIRSGRSVYTFRLYYTNERYIKLEINFIEHVLDVPKKLHIKAITDYFDAKELLFSLGIHISKCEVLSYSLHEIMLEKYRALLTRKEMQERDLFDIFLLPSILKESDKKKIIIKIKESEIMSKNIKDIVKNNLLLLQNGSFFETNDIIETMSIFAYDKKLFIIFKENSKSILKELAFAYLKDT